MTEDLMPTPFRCGFIAIVGRPNVGKSTLLNHFVGQKISITSRKAQTTRHRVNGIYTDETAQYVFVDTPGFQTKHRNALNQAMNQNVTSALSEVDVVVFVIEALKFSAEDIEVLRLLPKHRPVFLVISKVDTLENKDVLFPFIDKVKDAFSFAGIIPLSAQKNLRLDVLKEALYPHLPEGIPLYPEDQVTDRNERFLAAELVREKIFRMMGDELPYAVNVEVEKFEVEGALRKIYIGVLVDRPGHKAILIGKKGEKLKEISTQARKDMETLFDGKVFLQVWVKVKSGWADDVRFLRHIHEG